MGSVTILGAKGARLNLQVVNMKNIRPESLPYGAGDAGPLVGSDSHLTNVRDDAPCELL
jgi:hypothetical protein